MNSFLKCLWCHHEGQTFVFCVSLVGSEEQPASLPNKQHRFNDRVPPRSQLSNYKSTVRRNKNKFLLLAFICTRAHSETMLQVHLFLAPCAFNIMTNSGCTTLTSLENELQQPINKIFPKGSFYVAPLWRIRG